MKQATSQGHSKCMLNNKLLAFQMKCNKIKEMYTKITTKQISQMHQLYQLTNRVPLKQMQTLQKDQLSYNQLKSNHKQAKQSIVMTDKKESSMLNNHQFLKHFNKNENINTNINTNTNEHSKTKSNMYIRLNQKLNNLRTPYNEIQQNWHKNTQENKKIISQQIKQVYNQKIKKQHKKSAKNIKLFNLNTRCQIQQTVTQKRELILQQFHPFSNSLPITKIMNKNISVCNAPKKETKYIKVNKLQSER